MARTALFALAVIASRVAAELRSCGPARYDPTQYVCHPGDFLCPIIAGEPLSRCGGACYSTFQYSCNNGILAELQGVDSAYSLTVSNPTIGIHNERINAGGLRWNIGGQTASYCPEQVPRPSCPPGNVTMMWGGSAMAVLVPGGQQFYLDQYKNFGYTQAHSAYVPPGSTIGGLKAYKTGGLVNLNPGALGWVACPPRASGGGGTAWLLVGKYESNAQALAECKAINLKVTTYPEGTIGAWQYT